MPIKKTFYIAGVDEAGRGPLAGPVAVGVAVVEEDFDWALLPGVNDSKSLSEYKREEIYGKAVELKKHGKINFTVVMTGAKKIDNEGIAVVIGKSIGTGLKRLAVDPTTSRIKLDGSLKAPSRFTQQETIIKGDQKEKIIGLASIVAKVRRDRYMVQKATKSLFAPYEFASHKGYGTKAHRQAIKQHGLSSLHRVSYCYSSVR